MPCLKKKGNKTWKSYDSHDFGTGLKLTEHSYVDNPLVEHIKKLLLHTPMQLVWAGDYADEEPGMDDNLFNLAREQKPESSLPDVPEHAYLVNHDKKQYITYPKCVTPKTDMDPISFLCLETGEHEWYAAYDKQKNCLSGTWARDVVSIEDTRPNGYKEIDVRVYHKDPDDE